jgi:hypothetical protein
MVQSPDNDVVPKIADMHPGLQHFEPKEASEPGQKALKEGTGPGLDFGAEAASVQRDKTSKTSLKFKPGGVSHQGSINCLDSRPCSSNQSIPLLSIVKSKFNCVKRELLTASQNLTALSVNGLKITSVRCPLNVN